MPTKMTICKKKTRYRGKLCVKTPYGVRSILLVDLNDAPDTKRRAIRALLRTT